ncbi:hypothetical protein [uncultured Ruminobacter sp.]|uniref:hypothetical protein n=1 Tax=uncultured Ruminobacter sp. TaxID=538947 RepID=UPI002629C1EC|nr:hypothetical protein [uncultured Ruminobacter sp.]
MTGKKTSITVRGKTFESVSAMCRHYGIGRSRWNNVIKRAESPEKALDLCLSYESDSMKKVSINGMTFSSIIEASAYFGLNPTSVYTKISRHKISAEEAISSLISRRNSDSKDEVSE